MKQGSASVGHPVDIATGMVWTVKEDFRLPGAFPLAWERRYNTAWLDEAPTPLGIGWTLPVFATLTRIGKDYRYRSHQGDFEIFPDPDDQVELGQVVRSLGTFQEIAKEGAVLKVTRWNSDNGEVTRCAFAPGRNGQLWPMLGMEDAAGQGIDLAWDERGLLKGIRQRLERRTLAFRYAVDGKLAEVSMLLPDGSSSFLVGYEYDGQGRLAAAFDAVRAAERYAYDASGRMTREMARDGGVFSFRYDERGRCVHTSGFENYDMKVLRYRDNIGWTEVIDSLGQINRYQWLPTGQVVQAINPLGGISLTEYDEHGRITVQTDPIGGKTTYAYDEAGNRAEVSDPSGAKLRFEYNGRHQPIAFLDASGSRWERQYDESGRFISGLDPLGNAWTFEYGPRGALARATDPLGNVKHFPRDSDGKLTADVDWAGNATKLKWDAFGRVIESVDPLGLTTRTSFNAIGLPVEVIHPDGTKTRLQYDPGRNVIGMINPAGSLYRFQYGPCRRLLSVTDPLGRITRYSWDSEPDRLLKITNPHGEEHRFQYNALGKVTYESTFDGRVVEYDYDPAGRVVGFTDGTGGTVLKLDALGRMMEKILPDGTSRKFEYGTDGKLSVAESPDGVLTFSWDLLGRPVKEDQGGVILERQYDAIGNLTTLSVSTGHTLFFKYDANGLTKELIADNYHSFGFARDAVGCDIRRALPGGARIEQEFNPGRKISAQKVFPSGANALLRMDTAVIERRFRYDPVGDLIGTQDSRWGESRFAYDISERLIQAAHPMGREDFVLDASGNTIRRHFQGTGQAEDSALEYYEGNRVREVSGAKFEYDMGGRRVKKTPPAIEDPSAIWEYGWDGESQLVWLKTPTGETWRYTYDAMGRRLSKQGDGKTFRYVWDETSLIQILVDGKPAESWVHLPHEFGLLAKLRAGKAYPVISDHLGMPREMLDSEGAPVWSAYFDAWGRILRNRETNESCDARFPGQWFDAESGLHYNLARYYDPETGHFLNPDPIGLAGGFNTYLYSDNPLKWIDPYGLCEFPRKTLRGVSLKWLNKNKPSGWSKTPTRDNEGWIWKDKSGVERLRFMRPTGDNPSANQWSRQANGYFRWQDAGGNYLDVDGNAVPQGHPQFNELTHIMYEGPL